MTISYTASVATCSYVGCFLKLLFRWKASIYKLIWPNIFLFLGFYYCLNLSYRFAMNDWQKKVFEQICLHCLKNSGMIPVSFVLGFYVSIVVKRWWDQFISIPWPDPLAVLVSVYVTGSDVRSRLMRRTVMRYVNLSLVMTFRSICPSVKKTYPTLKHLVDNGYLLNNELEVLNKLESKSIYPKYWVPIVWAAAILSRARREQIIKDDMSFNSLIDELNKFRQGCLNLFSYDWISIPLVYTQVVTIAVYSYFLAEIFSSQLLDTAIGLCTTQIDIYFPIFAFLKFFFFMGWLLVAETMVNPFGENDDDIEVNWILDRNFQVSYLIVDEVHEEHPKLLKDPYWDDVFPPEKRLSKYSHRQNEPYLGSTWEMENDTQRNSRSQLQNQQFLHSTSPSTLRNFKSRMSNLQAIQRPEVATLHEEAGPLSINDKETTKQHNV